MRHISLISAAILAIGAPLAIAQVSGIDTTQSTQDRAAFPDSTLPQENRYIPQVRKKVATPLDELVDSEDDGETASAEEVEAFLDIEPKPVVPYSEVDADTAKDLQAE